MADDPHRDILPVKEGSCAETCRSSLVAGLLRDPRERHVVCKLDRYELEDRYLCVLDEFQALKKLYNAQEEKVKRLTTKLMRITAATRPCIAAALTIDEDKMRISALENENSKLKSKIFVLRNQILSHRISVRPPSRKLQRCASSGRTTCRSEGARTKMSNYTSDMHERDEQIQSYSAKIDELEEQRKDMMSRISELQDELENNTVAYHKEKTAQNVEYIKVFRQLKQQEGKLARTEESNKTLRDEIEKLKKRLDETYKDNGEISAALVAEKTRMSELDDAITKSKDTQMTLREKDEQIRDLMSEIKILQQHNTELIALSAKYSQVEVENAELRKKISEQEIDNHNLKSAFNNEQANITALQAANGQLMEKLQDLQKNMDTLTIQLKSFQKQSEKSEKGERLQTFDDVKKTPKKINQTTSMSPQSRPASRDGREARPTKTQSTLAIPEKAEIAVQTDFCSTDRLNDPEVARSSPLRNHGKPVETIGSPNFSRDEMLKLLDQAQINVPQDSHGVKMRALEGFSPAHRQSFLSEYGNANIFDRHEKSKALDQNNNMKNVKLATSTPKKVQETIINTDEEGLEDKDCVCDSTDRSFKSALHDIGVSLEKTLNNVQKSWQKEVFPQVRHSVNYYPKCIGISGNTINKESNCPVLVTDQQGLVEIHITSLQLSSFAMSHVFGDFNACPSLFISSDFCGQGSIFTPTQTYPTLNFNSSCVYRISKLLRFLDCVLRDHMHFQIHMSQPGGAPCAIAHGEVSVRDILDYPQNKLYYIANMECTVPCYRDANFGQLFFWMKLSCDVDRVRTFKEQRKLIQATEPSAEGKKLKQETTLDSSRRGVTEPDQISDSTHTASETLKTIHDFQKSNTDFESPVNSYQSKSSKVSVDQYSDTFVGYRRNRDGALQKRRDSRKNWNPGDSAQRDEIRQTIQLNKVSISSPPDADNLFDDVNGVIASENWHRYKRKSLNSQANDVSNAIIIRIERLALFPRCSLLKDPDIHQLYVEFSFLGNYGLDLETVSVPIPAAPPYHLFFNYMKKFAIDEKSHGEQRKRLQEILSNEVDSSIKFTIVSEPLMEEMETKECIEVGNAYLNLREHVLTGGHHDISLIVSNTDGSDTIGTLKITLLGADAIRSCLPSS